MQTIIDTSKTKIDFGLKEIWEYRDLLLTLTYRDIRVRYAQTFLGMLWVVFQPLTTILIFTLIFGRVAKIDTGNIPYPLFAIAGLSSWTYFSVVMNQAGNSIIMSQNMIAKIYFPRLIVPLSKSIVGLVDFIVTFIILLIMMIIYNYVPSGTLVFFPFFILLSIISALMVGVWLSALTVRFRDLREVIPFFVQAGLYITPVAYPASLIPDQYRFWYFLNPMAGVVEGFRWSLFGGTPPEPLAIISACLVLVLLFFGIKYFKSVERIMADIV